MLTYSFAIYLSITFLICTECTGDEAKHTQLDMNTILIDLHKILSVPDSFHVGIISVDGYDFNLQTKFNLNEFVRTFSKWTKQFFKDIEACEMEWMVNELLRAHIKMPESR